MSLSKLGLILFSSFLIFATAPTAPAQNTQNPKGEKQTGTQQQGQATQDQKKATDKKATDKQATEKKDDSQTTEKKATAKKAKTGKKTSGVQSKETVREVQTALKNQGMDPGPIDGAMGPKTMAALRNFQSQNNLPATGKLDEQTQAALGVHATRSTATSRLGTEKVRQVQQALSDREYYYGDVNGVMNPETRQAVKEFQLLNEMPPTGVVTEEVIVALIPDYTEQAQIDEKSVDQQEAARYKPGVEVGAGEVAGAETQSDSQRKTADSSASNYDSGRTDNNQATAKADSTDKINKDASERIQNSVEVLQALTSTEDRRIPDDLLARAKAVAVIPHVVKGALGIGGRYGKGVVSKRLANGRWSAPAFIQIGGGSFGAQLGVSATDLVLVFTDEKGLDLLMKGKDLKLGVDASVAAGPIGRSAEAGVNANLETGVFAYSRSKGLFAGIALDGAVLDIDQSMNKKVYGESVSAESILEGKVPPNPTVRPFTDALSRISSNKVSER
ncbi:MAG TPA: YSC84-related protein [Terriglobia bacterium]|nr:YSC84-related protein [Terriglobia bacterium]